MHTSQTKTSHVPSLFDEVKDILILDETEKANLLNDFFASQSGVDDSGKSLPANYYPAPYVTLNVMEVTPEEVYKVLENSNKDKASGPDGIHNRILCEGAPPPSSNLLTLSVICSIPLLIYVPCQHHGKCQMPVPSLRVKTHLFHPIID